MMRWRVSSIINHQFLTATMILCSLLHRGQTLHRKEDIMTMLRSTRATWMRSNSISQEAKRAAETVSFVLARAGEIRDHDIDLDVERTTAATIGQDMSTNGNDSGAGLAFDGQATSQHTMDLYECKSEEPH